MKMKRNKEKKKKEIKKSVKNEKSTEKEGEIRILRFSQIKEGLALVKVFLRFGEKEKRQGKKKDEKW